MFTRSKACLSFLSGEMENNTKLLLTSVINSITLEVIYFLHNNITERFKNPDLEVMIHTDELQMKNNDLQRMLSKCEIRN